MSDIFSQSTSFNLDKAHYIECFQQSAPAVQLKDYRKAGFIGLMGLALMFVKSDDYYIAFFLIGLSLIEVLSIQYRQAWWVWRQLMSRAAYQTVTIIIDEQGITTQTKQLNTQLTWPEITSVEKTEKGLLLRHKEGVNYLSNSCLDEAMSKFILQKIEARREVGVNKA